MARLTVKTKVGQVLTDVTSVMLSDPTGAYGLRQGTVGQIIVADGTPMVRAATGIYIYDVDLPLDGVSYTWWAEVVYAGQIYHIERRHDEPSITVQVLGGDFDDVLAGNVQYELAEYGEPVTVYPPAGGSRSVTAIVTRGRPGLQDRPRSESCPITVQLANNASIGIAASELADPGLWHIGVRKLQGGSAVTMRVTRIAAQDAGMVTLELG